MKLKSLITIEKTVFILKTIDYEILEFKLKQINNYTFLFNLTSFLNISLNKKLVIFLDSIAILRQ